MLLKMKDFYYESAYTFYKRVDLMKNLVWRSIKLDFWV